jgi:hypothetical protein
MLEDISPTGTTISLYMEPRLPTGTTIGLLSNEEHSLEMERLLRLITGLRQDVWTRSQLRVVGTTSWRSMRAAMCAKLCISHNSTGMCNYHWVIRVADLRILLIILSIHTFFFILAR